MDNLHLLLHVERREDMLIFVLPPLSRKATVQQADHEANLVAEDRTIGDHAHDDARDQPYIQGHKLLIVVLATSLRPSSTIHSRCPPTSYKGVIAHRRWSSSLSWILV